MVSAFLHEVRAALVEKFVEVVETAPGERSDVEAPFSSAISWASTSATSMSMPSRLAV